MSTTTLQSAIGLANQNSVRFPNESGEYREARDALLAEEIELRRHIERVAEQRRALPPGGTVPHNHELIGENGPVTCSDLFGDKQTLAVYSHMYGPQREQLPAFNVFTRCDGSIRHFWSGEMGGCTADPSQGPRGAPDLMPLWTILDCTPEVRRVDWSPKLEYGNEGGGRQRCRTSETAPDQ